MSSERFSRTTAPGDEATTNHGESPVDEPLALVIAWSAEEPTRLGEVAIVDGSKLHVLGRTESGVLVFQRQRPGETVTTGPLLGSGISRRQLTLRARGDALIVERVGRCPMRINGAVCDRAVVVSGDTILLRGQLLLLVIARPKVLAAARSFPAERLGEFGHSDALGMIGESANAHRIRDQVAFAARAGGHVLIQGESGTGKELTARALHVLSNRPGPLVARNAATVPEGLIDAELFGNAKDYPNPGMSERRGLIGEADGGTLFLDEIGELPHRLQSHLLRVLDVAGEYQRLGESMARRADIRLIGATHRSTDALRHDFAARLSLRVSLPPLEQRRDDIPLLVRHLLRETERRHAELLAGFDRDETGVVQVAAGLMEHLLRRSYVGNVRELEALLWQSLQESTGKKLVLSEEMRSSLPREEEPGPREVPGPQAVRDALAASGGNLAHAARSLGLSSRFALYRLLRKHGIDPRAPGE
jgi:two-component system, NtrC family, response regulator HydG